MKKGIINLILIIIAVTGTVSAQSIEVNDADGIVYRINLQTCTKDSVTDMHSFSDIAFNIDGDLIAVTNSSIYVVDTLTGLNSPPIHTYEGNGMTGLAISNSNHYYAATNRGEIFVFDPIALSEDSIAKITNLTMGDITFQNEYLIHSGTNNTISRFDLTNSLLFDETVFSEIDGAILGLSSTWHECELKTYATSFNGGADGTSTIYKLDFDSKTAIEVCTFEFHAFGSAFRNEYLCSLDSNSLAELCIISNTNSEIDKTNYQIYPNPTNKYLNFATIVDEISIYSLDGQLIEKYIELNNRIDISHIPNGLYIINTVHGNQIILKY